MTRSTAHQISPRRRSYVAYAAFIVAVTLASCQREGGAVDEATVDKGEYRNAAVKAEPPQSQTTLPGGAVVLATPTAKALQSYLASNDPAGRRFALPEIRFVEGQVVREDPNGSVANLTAILRAYPATRIRIEVARPAAYAGRSDAERGALARKVSEVFVNNGLPAGRVESGAGQTGGETEPEVWLAVTAK